MVSTEQRAANPVVYLPIESASRELDSRLLVTRKLLQAGFVVVLGAQAEILTNVGTVAPGVILFKGANRIQCNWMEKAKAAGHVVALIDEEVFAVREPAVMNRDIDPRAAGHCDTVLALNDVHVDVLKDRGFEADQLVVTGNPRSDLLRAPYRSLFDDEAEALSRQHGRFVLVNSNACAVNSIWGSVDDYYQVCVRIGWLDPHDANEREAFRTHLVHDQESFVAMRALLDILPAALPDHRILLRPHPSERLEPWAEAYAGRDSLCVTREGNHVALIRAADLVLHTSCTTGVEAALLDRPVVSIVPDGAPAAHWFLSNTVNPVARTAAQAAEMARTLLVDGDDPLRDGQAERGAAMIAHFGRLGGAHQAAFDVLRDRLPAEPDRAARWHRDPLIVRPDVTEIDKVKISLTADGLQRRIGDLDRADGAATPAAVTEVWPNLFELRPR